MLLTLPGTPFLTLPGTPLLTLPGTPLLTLPGAPFHERITDNIVCRVPILCKTPCHDDIHTYNIHKCMCCRVFEPRYRRLIQCCQKSNGCFALASYGVGITAMFDRVVTQDDASHNVTIRGGRRFLVQEGSARIVPSSFGLTIVEPNFIYVSMIYQFMIIFPSTISTTFSKAVLISSCPDIKLSLLRSIMAVRVQCFVLTCTVITTRMQCLDIKLESVHLVPVTKATGKCNAPATGFHIGSDSGHKLTHLQETACSWTPYLDAVSHYCRASLYLHGNFSLHFCRLLTAGFVPLRTAYKSAVTANCDNSTSSCLQWSLSLVPDQLNRERCWAVGIEDRL